MAEDSRSQTGQGVPGKARVPSSWSSPLPLLLGHRPTAPQPGWFCAGWYLSVGVETTSRGETWGPVGEASLVETCRKKISFEEFGFP